MISHWKAVLMAVGALAVASSAMATGNRPGVAGELSTCAGEARVREDKRPILPPRIASDYRLAFEDDFAFLDADPEGNRKWTNRIWYEPPPPPGLISIEDCVLVLRARKLGGRWIGSTLSTAAPDLRHGTYFRRGYFEARMRWTGLHGAWPAFWLLSRDNAVKATRKWLTSEFDIFEGQGADPTIFWGTLHRNTNGAADWKNDNYKQRLGRDLSREWHVYGGLWERDYVAWYLDGRELMRWRTFDSTNQDMFLLLNMWTGGWSGEPDGSAAEFRLEVDWVRVWRKGGHPQGRSP